MSRLDRELPPYVAQHNLGVASFDPARDPGAEPEVLAEQSFHQRQSRYRKAIRQLRDLAASDPRLHRRAHDARGVGYPSGGAEGSRRSGISDPTYLAAEAGHRRVKDPAELALDAIEVAVKSLNAAVRHRDRALKLTAAEGVLAEMDDEIPGDDDWCTNCIQTRVDKRPVLNPRGQPKDVGKDSTLCRGCHDFEREHGFPMPSSLIRKRERQGKLYPRDVEMALRNAQTQKPPE